MDDAQLKSLTVKELLELQAEVELAIRAAIRAKREKKPAVAAAPKKIDLERERDAWLSSRK